MPFFPRLSYPSTFDEFSPFFRLAEDLTSTSKFGTLFSPNFDVHETETEYVLEGELPGLDKKNLNIEFSDRNNLVVSGKVESSIETSERPEPTNESKTSTEGSAQSESTEGKEVEKKSSGEVTTKTTKPKYWVSERSVGSFRRTFRFPAPINEEAVQANLEHGILKIVAPKAAPPQKRRIDIQ